jgi:tetratricopeptide (TPR) repeat protein
LVINRNKDWYSNETLFIHDVEVVPGSINANYYAGGAFIDKSDAEADDAIKMVELRTALLYFKKAIQIDSTIPDVLQAEGAAYSRMNDIENAEKSWDKLIKINPTYADIAMDMAYLRLTYNKLAMQQAKAKNYEKSIYYTRKALLYDNLNVELWYNLGAQYYNLHDYKNARQFWQKTLLLDSTFELAKQSLKDLQAMEAKK